MAKDDFEFDELFMELNAGADPENPDAEPNGTGTPTHYTCYISLSVIASVFSMTSASDPSNTYTELGCCYVLGAVTK